MAFIFAPRCLIECTARGPRSNISLSFFSLSLFGIFLLSLKSGRVKLILINQVEQIFLWLDSVRTLIKMCLFLVHFHWPPLLCERYYSYSSIKDIEKRRTRTHARMVRRCFRFKPANNNNVPGPDRREHGTTKGKSPTRASVCEPLYVRCTTTTGP